MALSWGSAAPDFVEAFEVALHSAPVHRGDPQTLLEVSWKSYRRQIGWFMYGHLMDDLMFGGLEEGDEDSRVAFFLLGRKGTIVHAGPIEGAPTFNAGLEPRLCTGDAKICDEIEDPNL